MITVQQIITQVKSIEGGLVGISRSNRGLWQQLKGKCQTLEKQLVANCDKLEVGAGLEGNSPELIDSYQALRQVYESLQAKYECSTGDMRQADKIMEEQQKKIAEGLEREEGMTTAIAILQKGNQVLLEDNLKLTEDAAVKLAGTTNNEQSVKAEVEKEKEAETTKVGDKAKNANGLQKGGAGTAAKGLAALKAKGK